MTVNISDQLRKLSVRRFTGLSISIEQQQQQTNKLLNPVTHQSIN